MKRETVTIDEVKAEVIMPCLPTFLIAISTAVWVSNPFS